MAAIDRLKTLVERFQAAKTNLQLENSSEATIRAWIDELLSIFGWDVQNTQQVQTEHTLGRSERERLHGIGSTNTRPDYTLVNGNVPLAFIDAKSLGVDIEHDKDAAFQIRSYGWSIGAPFSIVTNFEQMAVYNCSVMPNVNDEADFARTFFFICDQYIENFETLQAILLRSNVIAGNLRLTHGNENALDGNFSIMLGEIRKELAKAIIKNNQIDNISTLSYYVQTIINRILFIRVCESRGLEIEGLLKRFSEGNFWNEFKNSSYADFYNHYDGPMFKRIPPLQSLSIDNEVFDHFLNYLYYPSPYRFDVIPLKTLSDIYDLFLGYQLVVDGDTVTDELKSEFKKSNGAVTTPLSLVNRVINCTLTSPTIENLTIPQILQLKIVDIACGSGVFIVGAYDNLVNLIEKSLALGEKVDDAFAIRLNGKYTLTIEGRRSVINTCWRN